MVSVLSYSISAFCVQSIVTNGIHTHTHNLTLLKDFAMTSVIFFTLLYQQNHKIYIAKDYCDMQKHSVPKIKFNKHKHGFNIAREKNHPT